MKQFNPVILLILVLLPVPFFSLAHSNPELVEITFASTDVTCHGGSDGSIDLTVIEGVAPFTYVWSNGATTEDITNLSAGIYSVTVTDAEDMMAMEEIQIGEPDLLQLILTALPPTCPNGNNGIISVEGNGGIQPYEYYWSNGFVGPSLGGLSEGDYSVTVVDQNGCATSQVITIVSNNSAIILTGIVEDASCSGANGSIDLSVGGGTPPYTYEWNVGPETQDIDGLNGGSYMVTVTDALGCTEVGNYLVEELAITAEVSNITCDNNGTPGIPDDDVFFFDLLVNGGHPTGWFSGFGINGMYNVVTTFGPFNIADGPIVLTITDNEEPTCNTTLTIAPPPAGCDAECAITAAVNNITCDDNGTPEDPGDDLFYFDVLVEGQQTSGTWIANDAGTTSGDYGQATTFGPYPVSGGNLLIEITDSADPNCTTAISVAAPFDCACQFNQMQVSIMGDLTVPCTEGAFTTVTAFVTGGTPPYTYLWSHGDVGEQVSLTPGIYTVTTTDANGCSIAIDVTIEYDSDLIAEAGPDQVITCLSPSVELDGSASSSGPDITYEWVGPMGSIVDQAIITVDQPGTYLLTVYEDGNEECAASDYVIVTVDIIDGLTISTNLINCDSAQLNYGLVLGIGFPHWTYPDGSTSSESTIGTTQNGYHVLSVINENNGCTLVDSVLVELNPDECATITGRLVRDTMLNCMPDTDEPGLSGWIIAIEGQGEVYFAVTQSDGSYEQRVPLGDYDLYPILVGPLWDYCEDAYPVSLTETGETVTQDMAVMELEPCPDLRVWTALPILRRCWDRTITIHYCNDGTSTAEDAYVDVTLDEFFTFESATVPFTAQGGNIYTFNIGDVEVGECGFFHVNVTTSCDAVVGQSLCVEAKIFPNEPCTPPDAGWSGSSLQVSAECETDEVVFTIKNVGVDMVGASNFIVIEDGVMLMVIPDTVLLEADETFEYGVPANGSTYRMEVDQVALHPGMSHPTAFVEGCGTNNQGTFSTGFVNQFSMDDDDDFIDIDCREIVGSYDPNDKHGFPRGYGEEHYIKPGTGLEYLINFQNTGNDTAFLVVLRDTLSPHLDIRTIRAGASSHPYTWDIEGGNVLVFTFENILLPDSTTNLLGSQGYVEFQIEHVADLPLETLIENSASIYFDVNEPVITNTTWHRLGEDFIEVVPTASDAPEPQGFIQVFPNPMNYQTRFVLDNWLGNNYSFTLNDARGQIVFQDEFRQNVYNFHKGRLATGVYFYQITSNRGESVVGKLLIK